MASLDFAALPWTHPGIFIGILEHCDGFSVLSCRLVCSAWRDWLARTPVWYRIYRKSVVHFYRLFKNQNESASEAELKIFQMFQCRVRKLMELTIALDDDAPDDVDEESYMRLVLRLEKSEQQLIKGLMPSISEETMKYISSLEKVNRESEKPVKFLGPISLFIRLKVDDPSLRDILCELMSRYLSSILVNRKDQAENPRLKCLIFKSMSTGQNWTSHFFNAADEQEGPQAEVHDLHRSPGDQQPAGQKRRLEAGEEEEGTSSSSKMARLDQGSSGGQDKAERDESTEEEEEEEDKASVGFGSLYTVQEQPVLAFPTVIDLLDVDNPVIARLLNHRLSLDKTIVVPRIEDFIFYQDKHPDLVTGGWEIIGRDDDGNVCKVDPKQFRSTDTALIGYIENPDLGSCGMKGEHLLKFWGGRDIRDRWPAFAQHLARPDQPSTVKKVGNQLNLPVISSQPTSSASVNDAAGEGTSSSSGSNMDFVVNESVVEMLAARGITLTRQ